MVRTSELRTTAASEAWSQFHEYRKVQHRRDRGVVHRKDGSVRSRGFQLAGQPLQLRRAQFAVVEPGHSGIQGNDTQAIDEVTVVHWFVTAGLVQQPPAEVGAV